MKILIFLIFSFLFLKSQSERLTSENYHDHKKKEDYHFNKNSFIEKREIKLIKSNNYNRKNWRHWHDQDNDCQNLRHELLISNSEKAVRFKTSKKCIVLTGKWLGHYSRKYFYNSKDVDIDHVVPLKEAWLSGGKNWMKKEKEIFANDHNNLLIVDKKLNRKKGAKDIANWLPPNQEFICEYLKIWINIKNSYKLKYDKKEKKTIANLKEKCLITSNKEKN